MVRRLLAATNAVCGDHSMHLCMTILSGLSAFVILFTGETSALDNSEMLRNVLHSGQYWHGSSLVSLALIVPLLTDTMINIGAYLWARKNKQETTNRTKDIHSITESLIFQGGMLLPVIMPFLPDSARYPTIVHCFFRAHLGVVLGVIVASNVRFDPKFCPPVLVMVYYLLAIACNALFPYAQHSFVPSNTNILSTSDVALAATVTQYLAVAIIFLALIRSITVRLWDKLGKYFHATTAVKPEAKIPEPGSVNVQNRESAYMWYRIAYLCANLFWICFRCILPVSSHTVNFLDNRDYDFFLYNVPSIVFQIFFLVLSIRVVRLDAVASLYSLIEAKKQYVRYIR